MPLEKSFQNKILVSMVVTGDRQKEWTVREVVARAAELGYEIAANAAGKALVAEARRPTYQGDNNIVKVRRGIYRAEINPNFSRVNL